MTFLCFMFFVFVGSSPVASEARPVKDEEKEKSLSPTSDVEVAPNKGKIIN